MRPAIFKLATILILAAAAVHLVSFSAAAKVIERVIVAIDSEPYTLSDVKTYARTSMKQELSSKDLSSINEVDKIILEQFITNQLITAEVTRLGIKIGEQDVDHYINMVKEKSRINDEQLVEALRREGMDLQRYRASIRSEIQKQELIKQQVEGKVDITEEDVQRYYRVNERKFTTRPKIHLRHILLQLSERAPSEKVKATLENANTIRQRAQQGEPFTELAKKHSQGDGASDGGDLGWLIRDDLMKEIADAAFDVPDGQVSAPVRTSLGYHLIKVEARLRGEPIPLEKVEKQIRKELLAKAMEERFQQWLKTDLRRRHRVDIKLPGFVFRAEETKESTVDSLMVSSSPDDYEEEKTLLNRLNPFSTSPVKSPTGEVVPDLRQVKLFGFPLFTTERGDDVDGDLADPEETSQGSESRGFWGSINPF